jgi:acetylornithine deacetylase/succinyl-diaminopimelate desuccinylase-like protein
MALTASTSPVIAKPWKSDFLSAGSIPVVTLLKESLGMDSIPMLGWGNPDDGPHSPNERFSLDDFHRGVRSVAALLYELAGL